MKGSLRSLVLGLALMASVALSGCLQDEKDPAAPVETGKLTGAFYAAGLGNVAVQIQNAVMGNANWFTALNDSMELNLASMGISPNALGSTVKSYVCPVGDGTAVHQITWIDGRNENNKFAVKGIGTDAGKIVHALRSRVAPYQVGIYQGGSSIALASGDAMTIPSTCGGIPIPLGTPVLAFKIDRPAPPTEELARTEYRTVSCGTDADGLARRGTQVQKRIITFQADGSIVPGAWETDNMGNCVDDVVVEIADRASSEGGGTSDLANFAAIALRDLLTQQLAMNCMSVRVTSNKRTDKEIDTCGNVRPNSNDTVQETNAADQEDVRVLQCAGSTALNMIRFHNLRYDKLGLSTTSWTSGQAIIRRTIDNQIVNNDLGQEAKRLKWLGTDVNCGGQETFYVTCNKIPGDPPLEARRSNSKWIQSGIQGWFVDESWFANVFNLCWFGSCTRVIGGHITNLNPQYFTGTYIHSYAGTTTVRGMQATTWLNNETFKPNAVPSTTWRIPEATNYCIWEQRVMIAACPMIYDPGQQGNWAPSYTYAHSRPVALDPGINGGSSSAGRAYNSARADGHLTAQVALLWEDCNFKGCDYWWETAGPGTGVYIKSWSSAPVDTGAVYLSPSAKVVRTEMCKDMQFQLDSSGMLEHAYEVLAQKNAAVVTAENNMTVAQTAMNTAQGDLDTAAGTTSVKQAAVDSAQDSVTTREGEQQIAQAAYDADPTNPAKQSALTTANANLANAQAALATAQSELSDAQAAQATAQTAFNTAQTNYNNAVAAHAAAVADRDATALQVAEAEAAASMGVGRDLTPEERGQLEAVYNGICVTQNDTLNGTEQQMIRTYCAGHYNTNEYAALPGLGLYCDEVFDKSGSAPSYTLTFKDTTPAAGTNVQTTLLNTEGVMLAHKPTLVTNDTLVVTQRDFTQPLNCLRQEERYHSWPRIYYYWVCGGKGGCWRQQATEWFTITESTTRQWTGLSYAGGSWSLPSYGFRSKYGNWTSYSSIPYPLY